MREQLKVLILDDDESMRWVMGTALDDAGFETRCLSSADGLEEAIGSWSPDVLVSDIRMPGTDGLDLARRLRESHPDLPVVLITAHSDLETAVSAYDTGAFDYLPKPFDLDELVQVVQRAAEHIRSPGPGNLGRASTSRLIGTSTPMQQVFRAIGRLARSEVTVLITGESGTGKELVARALHENSPRRGGPFVAVNMAAIPSELIESELFGHEKGAFTGARERHPGLFEQAGGGTLFLDEIGDMPMAAQTRLLRVLAEGVYYRVGGRSPLEADVRIVAATHRDLRQRVEEGHFREDLFHRLNVVHLNLPPLRERPDDVPALVDHFLAEASRETGMAIKRPSPELLEHLKTLPWPGNVRQLENLCRWITVMVTGHEVRPQDLPEDYRRPSGAGAAGDWEKGLRGHVRALLRANRREDLQGLPQRLDLVMLDEVLQFTGGHKSQAAEWLGWGRNTVTRKLKQRHAQENDRD
jgi:two-component system nitrogen regulation response regulator GlnG